MTTRMINPVLLFILAVFLTACVATSSVSVVNVTQPVLLGKVKRLHGENGGPLGLKASFNFEHQDRMYDWYRRDAYAGSKADSEFVMRIDSENDRIVVDEIYVGSYSLLAVVPNGYANTNACWVNLRGGIYRVQAGENEKK